MVAQPVIPWCSFLFPAPGVGGGVNTPTGGDFPHRAHLCWSLRPSLPCSYLPSLKELVKLRSELAVGFLGGEIGDLLGSVAPPVLLWGRGEGRTYQVLLRSLQLGKPK